MRRTLLIITLVLLAGLASAAVELHGEPVQGALLVGQAPPGSIIRLDGERVQQASSGHFLLGFGRDEQGTRKLRVELPSGEMIERELTPGVREFDIQRIDGLPPAQVTPDESALARIRAEAAMTRQARERRDDRADFAEGFIWPVTGPVTGVYGSQRILNGEPRNPHWGIDIAAPTGTPVRAPAAGIVTLAHDDMYFSGGTLILDHGLGLSSAFLHLSEILVGPGDAVAQGEVIARVGATGRVTGAHLDWRMNFGSLRVDPQLLLGAMPEPESAASAD
ncbi:MAG: M23 family metallopeptidase [Wenzhouxiangellaceae bacterium]|nr:M23 family metallopeptidase [Wenzhouxiangellaceae bacterium]